VIFFSDEAYRWLCADGKKASPKYTVKEFDELFGKAKTLMTKLRVNPIDVEKVAFVLIKENEPVYEPKPKKEPSGLPRGRPSKPDSEKKAKKPTVPGRGRGRPPKTVNGVALKTPKPPKEAKKKRGRPFGMRGVVVEEKEEEKKEEEKKKDDDEGGDKEEEVTPAPKSAKRKATETPKDTPAKRTRKSNA
jgi:hypothetical protein